MSLYLDTNVFYNAYSPVEEQQDAELVFSELEARFYAITSEWTLSEMFRAFKKQVNLGALTDGDAETALDFVVADIGEMVQRRILKLIPITRKQILSTREIIFSQNLYSADALHAIVAAEAKADVFVTFDSDFEKKMIEMPVINPTSDHFPRILRELKEKTLDFTD